MAGLLTAVGGTTAPRAASGVESVLASTLARGAAAAFAANAAALLLATGAQILLARTMGPLEYGIYASVIAWLGILLVPALAGFDTAALRFVATYTARRDAAAMAAFVRFARNRTRRASLGLSLALLLAAMVLQGRVGTTMAACIALGALLLPLNASVQLATSLLQAAGRPVLGQAIQGMMRPVIVAGAVGVISMTAMQVTSPLAMTVTTAAALAAVGVFAAVRPVTALPGGPDGSIAAPALVSEWRSTSTHLCAMSAAQVVLVQADVALLGLLAGTTEAGIYSVASRLVTVIAFGITAVNIILAPRIAALHAEGRLDELQHAVRLASWLVAGYAVPVAVALAVAGRFLLALFGPAFTAAYPVLMVLAAGQLAIVAAGSVGFLMTMTGFQRDATRVLVASAAAAVVLNVWLIPRFGALGAAAGTVAGIILRTVVLTILVRRRIGITAGASTFR